MVAAQPAGHDGQANQRQGLRGTFCARDLAGPMLPPLMRLLG
jgi:hypothetical protein